MRTINIKCACGAQPGDKCRDVGYADESRNASGFHFSRARAAQYITTAETRQTREANKKLRDARAAKEKG